MTSTYLNYLTFERSYGRPLRPVNTETIEDNSKIAKDSKYFRQNIGKVSSGFELAQDDRLYRYALTAFGLSDQIPNKDFIIKVLDEGIFDPFQPFESQEEEFAGRSEINDLAKTFWLADRFILDDQRQAAIDTAVNRMVSRYTIRSPEAPAIVNAEVDYFRNNIENITSGQDVVDDPRLFAFVQRAFVLEDQSGNSELIAKAIDAGVYNPKAAVEKENALANTLTDSRYKTLARAFAFNEIGDGNTRNTEFVDRVVETYEREALRIEQREARNENVRRNAFPKQYEREIAYFTENIGKVSTAEELLADERLYRFALAAFDLESQVPYRALIKKVLEEGIASDDALANQLTDRKFREFAGALGLAEVGDRNTRNPNFVADVVERFKRVKVEADAGEENVGVRLAAYFDRKASNITSWFSVLGDRALREVAFTAFDLPDEMQQTNPDKLVRIFEDRFDIEDFKDPEKLGKFIQRFTVMYDVRNGSPGGPQSNLLSLYGVAGDGGGGSGVVTIDPLTTASLFG